MAYEYIERRYKVKFQPGMRVRHIVTKKQGEVRRPGNCPGHYVSVWFDGHYFNSPCHPDELDILAEVSTHDT